ncbi:uncharacterized protein BJ171DRAFT_418294 [Polychytrium aggregatum]|uniref:uncharacterized protein n=1 Tax=Polychytrium aggregatum TaxID=110093 RepID=UPI0022FE29FB|nr:uncharacterized protein BJ171DRAFT_418294 [Polychytrium aggregatum]KAI9209776.1 hypothetical protein BJ171DRAFT_418294 [Polychytrium aggregatum]
MRGRSYARLTLISPSVIGDTGEMTYNPVLQKWEGNERILKDFEQGLPVRPALITNIGGNKVAQIVGNMVFDPVKMTWNRIKSQDNAATADDDDDIFKDFGDCLTVPDEKFELPKSVVEGFYISESSHKLFMGNWYPRALSSSSRSVGRDNISKTHLYDIRTVRARWIRPCISSESHASPSVPTIPFIPH